MAPAASMTHLTTPRKPSLSGTAPANLRIHPCQRKATLVDLGVYALVIEDWSVVDAVTISLKGEELSHV
jgi:hypothetical protein